MSALVKKLFLLLTVSFLAAIGCSSNEPEVYVDDEFDTNIPQEQQEGEYKSSKDYTDEDWFYDYYDYDEEAEKNLDSDYDFYDVD